MVEGVTELEGGKLGTHVPILRLFQGLVNGMQPVLQIGNHTVFRRGGTPYSHHTFRTVDETPEVGRVSSYTPWLSPSLFDRVERADHYFYGWEVW